MDEPVLKKKWYKRWWAITLFVFFGLIVLLFVALIVLFYIYTTSGGGGEYYNVGSTVKIYDVYNYKGHLNVKIMDISKRSYSDGTKEITVKIEMECVDECPGFRTYDVQAYNNSMLRNTAQRYYTQFESSMYDKLSSYKLILSPGERYQTSFTIEGVPKKSKYVLIYLGKEFKIKV